MCVCVCVISDDAGELHDVGSAGLPTLPFVEARGEHDNDGGDDDER